MEAPALTFPRKGPGENRALRRRRLLRPGRARFCSRGCAQRGERGERAHRPLRLARPWLSLSGHPDQHAPVESQAHRTEAQTLPPANATTGGVGPLRGLSQSAMWEPLQPRTPHSEVPRVASVPAWNRQWVESGWPPHPDPGGPRSPQRPPK